MTRTALAFYILGVLNLVGRGTDYLWSPRVDTPPEVLAVGPLEAWGWMCMIAASVICVGLITRRIKITITGGMIAAATYTVFALQRLVLVFTSPPISDWRYATSIFAAAGFWVILTVSTIVRNAVVQARICEGRMCDA